MKLKRNKQYRKTLQTYETYFGFRQPYLVLVDGTFISSVVSKPQDLQTIIDTALQATTKCLVTPCILQELKELKEKNPDVSVLHSAHRMARNLQLRICKHHPTLSGRECIGQVIGKLNEPCFMVASQDVQLRGQLRHLAARQGNPVPMLHQNRAVTVMEPISDRVLSRINEIELSKNVPDTFEVISQVSPDTQVVKKRRRASEPNPLSCKKPKKQQVVVREVEEKPREVVENIVLPVVSEEPQRKKKKRARGKKKLKY